MWAIRLFDASTNARASPIAALACAVVLFNWSIIPSSTLSSSDGRKEAVARRKNSPIERPAALDIFAIRPFSAAVRRTGISHCVTPLWSPSAPAQRRTKQLRVQGGFSTGGFSSSAVNLETTAFHFSLHDLPKRLFFFANRVVVEQLVFDRGLFKGVASS